MPPTHSFKRSCMVAIACNKRPVLSNILTSIYKDKSPIAVRSATTTIARAIGAVTLTVIRQAITPPNTKAKFTSTNFTPNALLYNCAALALAAWVCVLNNMRNSFALACNTGSAG